MKINYFGISLVVAMVVLAGVLTWPMPNASDNLGPKGLTFAKMRRLEMHMLSFFSENGRWPEPGSWKQELSQYLAGDEAFHREQLLVDSWGMTIRYDQSAGSGHAKRILRSLGPNRLDEKGAGDDIILALYDPQSAAK